MARLFVGVFDYLPIQAGRQPRHPTGVSLGESITPNDKTSIDGNFQGLKQAE